MNFFSYIHTYTYIRTYIHSRLKYSSTCIRTTHSYTMKTVQTQPCLITEYALLKLTDLSFLLVQRYANFSPLLYLPSLRNQSSADNASGTTYHVYICTIRNRWGIIILCISHIIDCIKHTYMLTNIHVHI